MFRAVAAALGCALGLRVFGGSKCSVWDLGQI